MVPTAGKRSAKAATLAQTTMMSRSPLKPPVKPRLARQAQLLLTACPLAPRTSLREKSAPAPKRSFKGSKAPRRMSAASHQTPTTTCHRLQTSPRPLPRPPVVACSRPSTMSGLLMTLPSALSSGSKGESSGTGCGGWRTPLSTAWTSGRWLTTTAAAGLPSSSGRPTCSASEPSTVTRHPLHGVGRQGTSRLSSPSPQPSATGASTGHAPRVEPSNG
mmetsp:Transcript_39435/g.98707  ORF Transcript_39435/g.98707 Transcript_39435/m.98707 type:complete len:218 (-) Transcript_39435:1943-2596(-)